ncbi:MAG: methyltransferase [Chloroflexi bacterium HGW-Chloroflexi-6]|nr:MAG: methyltransferase [Chloroflexi bacterium HGW-Chloroflexi-6]
MFKKSIALLKEIYKIEKLKLELSTKLPASKIDFFLTKFKEISNNVECPHNPSHILTFVSQIFTLPKNIEGCIVEAGCFKGGSTAKFSLIASYLDRELIIFDSFEGLPENQEEHKKTIHGLSVEGWFQGKEFSGSLEEVKHNVKKYGDISCCTFIKGWFDHTMSNFNNKICAAYLDVDLASSTKTCIQYLYPKIVPGGVLVSQDGDFPLVIDVFDDENFWIESVGYKKPKILGLHKEKMLVVRKEV